jgi:hypothetical protein
MPWYIVGKPSIRFRDGFYVINGAGFISVHLQAKSKVKIEDIINESNKLVSQFITEGLKCQSAFDVVDPN